MAKIIESIVTKNRCYTGGRKITVRGLMLHSVGCPQPKASVFVNTWNSPTASVCPHGVIDGNDGTVYQTLPWDHRGWHGGSGSRGSGNNTHIGIEMCEPACIRYTSGSSFTCSDTEAAKAVVRRTYKSAVELFATLNTKYGLNPLADGVIISHKEGCARGIASNHGDPEHLWDGLGIGYTMDTFRAAVCAKMQGINLTFETNKSYTIEKSCYLRTSAGASKTNKAAYSAVSEAVKKKCRKKDGYAVFKKGKTFRLVSVKSINGNIWGKLKSGWWIPLIYNGEIRIK